MPVATGYTVTGKVGDTFSNPLSGMTNVEITTGQWEEAYTTTGTYTIEYVVFNEVITGCEASKIYSKTETITISVEAETPATGGNSGSSSGGSYYGGGG
ncbi:MAG: hypothetical protein LBG52_05280 [Candidatus Peribacteria bacterium]|nr:hypothetical protein [Candidatus Peribacteria bacterium]